MPITFNAQQQAEMTEVVLNTPWGDIAPALDQVEDALWLGMEATVDAFWLWEEQAESAGYGDEFSIGAAELDEMPDEWRLAYVARLLRTMAMAIGVSTEFSGQLGMRLNDRDAIAPLIRRMDRVATGGRSYDERWAELSRQTGIPVPLKLRRIHACQAAAIMGDRRLTEGASAAGQRPCEHLWQRREPYVRAERGQDDSHATILEGPVRMSL